jgi:putative endonuclease
MHFHTTVSTDCDWQVQDVPAARSVRAMSTNPTPAHRAGATGEDLAAQFLAVRGLEVIARNWRIADGDLRGELDLIALDHGTRQVVIVEVKARHSGGFGGPLGAVTPRKQARVRRLAVAFLVGADLPYWQVRFDVVGVRLDHDPPSLVHVQEAF